MARQDETLGWGTIGFWFAVIGIFLAVLVFGVVIPTSTQQASNPSAAQEPADRKQPAEQRPPTGGSTR